MSRDLTVSLAVLTVIFLLFPTTSAASSSALSAASLNLERAHAEGTLGGLSLQPPGAFDGASFSLSAESIGGYVDVSRVDYVVEGTEVTEQQNSREPISLGPVHSANLEAPDSLRLLVVPDAGAQFVWAGATGRAAPELLGKTFQARAGANTPDINLDVANSIGFDSSAGTIEVHGSFELVLWDGRLSVELDDGSQEFVTGLSRESRVPSPLGTRGVEQTEGREAHFLISNGTLKLNAQAGLLPYARDAVFSPGAGELVLHQATGNLPFIELNNAELAVKGEVGFSASAPSGRLDGSFSGTPDNLLVNGVAVRVPQESSTNYRSLLWVAWILLLVVAYAAYRFESVHGLRRVEALMAAGSYEAASRRAARLKWMPRVAEDAVVAQAVSLVRLGRTADAKRVLSSWTWGRDRVRPSRMFVSARIAAEEGQLDEAAELLVGCLALSPGLLLDAQADAVLGPLMRSHQSFQTGGYS